MIWTARNTLADGRVCYVNALGTELLQRPDGEWTSRAPSSPVRLELCTHDLEEAKARAGWTHEQWTTWRAERAAQAGYMSRWDTVTRDPGFQCFEGGPCSEDPGVCARLRRCEDERRFHERCDRDDAEAFADAHVDVEDEP